MFFRQKLLKHKYTDNFTDIVFFLWVKYIFFSFYQSVGFKGNNKYAEKRYYVSHGMR